jgi:hypothetical protein
MSNRTTREVFLDHLECAQRGDLATDIERNFSAACTLLTSYGVFRGHDGVRAAAALLEQQIGKTPYRYRTQMTDRDVAILEWTAESSRARIDDGADSYLIRNGRIEAMTIHYTVQSTRDQLRSGRQSASGF